MRKTKKHNNNKKKTKNNNKMKKDRNKSRSKGKKKDRISNGAIAMPPTFLGRLEPAQRKRDPKLHHARTKTNDR
jgi:hypothetical protein